MAEKIDSLKDIKFANRNVTNRAVLMLQVKEKTLLLAFGLSRVKAISPSMKKALINILPVRF